MRRRARSRWTVPLLALVAGLAGACSQPGETPAAGGAAAPERSRPAASKAKTPSVEATAGEAPAAETPGAADEGPLVVFLGDSLTAGLGVAEAEAFPERVRLRLAAEGVPVRVVNAGISGDTTAGGLARLDWLLRQQPDVLVVGLGANDGLRGLELAETEANLRAIVEGARAAGAEVLLLGMMLPPNYGPDYTRGFREIYSRLAGVLDVRRVPFLLAGVAGIPELNQADGIHPTAEGHRMMAGNVLPELRALLERAGRTG